VPASDLIATAYDCKLFLQKSEKVIFVVDFLSVCTVIAGMRSKNTDNKPPLSWREHTAENPFWDQSGPIEVMLVDESTEILRDPSGAKTSYQDIVKFWRPVPAWTRL
jgi:hypothetical protein